MTQRGGGGQGAGHLVELSDQQGVLQHPLDGLDEHRADVECVGVVTSQGVQQAAEVGLNLSVRLILRTEDKCQHGDTVTHTCTADRGQVSTW